MHYRLLAAASLAAFLFVGGAFASGAVAEAQENREQVCPIIINIINNSQYVDQTNIGPGVIQYISQELNISPTIVQTCVQEVTGDNNGNNNDRNNNDGNGGGGNSSRDISGVAAATAQYGNDEVILDTIPDKLLPNTGGSPLLLAVSGALLVVGFLLGRSVIKRS